jgi:hypothetical protein
MTELIAGHSCAWRTAPDRVVTERLCARIRQALNIASKHPDRFPELAKAYLHFTISIIEPGLIEAKPKVSAHVEVIDPPAIMGGAPHGKPISTVGKTTAAELIDSWTAHLPSNDPVNFQQTILSTEELGKLYTWAKSNIPELMLMVGKGFITVAPLDAGASAFAWTPATPPLAPEREDYNV